jgi:hypothetical protein
VISTSNARAAHSLVEDAARLHIHDIRGSFGFFGSHDLTARDGTVVKLRPDVGERYGWVHVEHWPVGAGWASSTYEVPVYAQDQHLGGVRWVFACPISGVRTPVLYLPAGGGCLGSRAAHGLVYRTQRLRAPGRAAARVQRLTANLGVQQPGALPVRPRGMWASTFARRTADLARLVEIADAPTPC